MQKLDVNTEIGHGTIKAAPTCDAEADATALRKAMKGIGKPCSWLYPLEQIQSLGLPNLS